MINKILVILFVITTLLFIININKESFRDYLPSKERKLYNIIPTLDNQYLATYIPEGEDSSNSNIIITRSLESNEWKGPIQNSAPDGKSIIIDLTYSKDKRLIGIGVSSYNNIKLYKIYIKETEDIRSPWENIPSNENIRSFVYDLNGDILGCRDDGQIFMKESEDLESDWIGPINFDAPMKKIMFDKDGKMLGIGLYDELIYKKKEHNWKKSKWDTEHIGEDKVSDIFHDYDGCLIGASDNGVLKQGHSNYMSKFLDLKDTKKKDDVLSLSKILFYRTGAELLNNNIQNTDNVTDPTLSKSLNEMLLFKNKTKGMCKNIDKDLEFNNDTNLLQVNKQMHKMDEIERLINILQN